MLDELLGRAPLHDEIAELTETIERLEAQLAAESERRRDAVRNKQDAEEHVNELQDRIAGLEGELQSTAADDSGPTFFRVETHSYRSVEPILHRLRSFETSEDDALTAAVDATIPAAVSELLSDHTELLRPITPCLLCLDDARLIRIALVPPRMPTAFETWGPQFDLADEWFLPGDSGSFALVRSDRFAIGSISNGSIDYTRGFVSDVMNTHSKGGFSQARFERRRDEQIADHVDRVEDILSTYASDSLIVVGDNHIIKRLSISPANTASVDASGKPEVALSQAFESFWKTRVYFF